MMKIILTLIIALSSFSTFGQITNENTGQKSGLEIWNEEAKTNIRLLPKYGYALKTEEQKKVDQEFVNTVLKQESSNRKASDNYISLGFRHLYNDIRTAMYRFNQAYLLDSTNTDIYWGFGGVYMVLGDYAKAEKQYLEGLAINPKNTHLLTDYGTNFMAQFYDLKTTDEKLARTNLETAITYMLKSYQLDPKDQNTTYKLSICYLEKGDCENAWKYYKICKDLGGQPITKDYTKELKIKCKK